MRFFGRDPYELYHYGEEVCEPTIEVDLNTGEEYEVPGFTGKPVRPDRYKSFLYACAIHAKQEHIKDLATAFGGTSEEDQKSRRKRRNPFKRS